MDWDYSTRARAVLRRAPDLPAARQGARRLELDQRDGLHPRQPPRLRRLGRSTAGATTTCCRTSSARRTTSAARRVPRRPAARSRSRTRARTTRCAQAFVEAAVEAGLPRNEDFNGAEQDGAAMYQLTQRGGMRCSAAVAFLHPAMERPNLTVMPFMQAHRVLFEGTRAVGVEAVAARRGQGVPRRARGDRQRRRVQLAAAADALGDRAGRAPDDARDRGRCSTSRWSARTCSTTRPSRRVHDARAGLAAAGARARGARAVPDRRRRGPFASNLAEAGGFARVDGRRRAGHPVPRGAGADRRRGHDRPDRARHVGRRRACCSRSRAAACTLASNDPSAQAGHPPQLLRGRARHAGADGGAAAAARHHAPARDGAVLRDAVHRAGTTTARTRCARTSRRHTHDALPPGGHVRDGRRRRRRAARERRGGRCASSTPR